MLLVVFYYSTSILLVYLSLNVCNSIPTDKLRLLSFSFFPGKMETYIVLATAGIAFRWKCTSWGYFVYANVMRSGLQDQKFYDQTCKIQY